MGQDISVHAEVRLDGRWHHWGQWWVPRDYNLFNALWDKGATGIPPDASDLTKHLAKDGDSGHTSLAPEDLVALAPTPFTDQLLQECLDAMPSDLPCRLVIWFES